MVGSSPKGGGSLARKIKRTSLEIPEDLWLRWKVQAAREGVSMRDLVIRELTRHLDRKGVKEK
jgi:hypothetical protein